MMPTSVETDGRGSGSAPPLMMVAMPKPSRFAGTAREAASQGELVGDDSDSNNNNNNNNVMPLEFDDGGDEICVADEEMTIFVTSDSGAVTHVTPPETLPRGAVIDTTLGDRDFVAANNGRIKNHGSANVELVPADGRVANCEFRVADTNRTLHSTSQTCDAGHEVLYMAKGAVVVPAGTLSKHLMKRDVRAQYPRKGGLYVAEMKIRAQRQRDDAAKKKSAGFTRPGIRR